jgi:hypothetical protein
MNSTVAHPLFYSGGTRWLKRPDLEAEHLLLSSAQYRVTSKRQYEFIVLTDVSFGEAVTVHVL